MRVIKVSDSYSNVHKRQSFKALNIDDDFKLKDAGENIAEGVKLSLLPGQRENESVITSIARYNDVNIGAFSKSSTAKGNMWLNVRSTSNGVTRFNDCLETAGKTAQEIASLLKNEVKVLFDEASSVHVR